MRFMIQGAERESGVERSMIVEASSAVEAEAIARGSGLLVSEIIPASKSRRPTLWRKSTFIIVIFAFFAGFIAAIFYMGSSNSVHPSSSQEVGKPTSSLSPADYGLSDTDPGFEISHDSLSDPGYLVAAGWIITNQRAAVLEISRVRLNGEWDCPSARYSAGARWFADRSVQLPRRIGIGESAGFFEYYIAEQNSYKKKVIFVEVETNRGTFMFDAAGMRLSQRP